MKHNMMMRFLAALLVLLLLIPLPAAAEERKFGTLLELQQAWETQWPSVSPGIRQIPQYFQTDYPNTPYRHGTIASGGCGVVCMAMAASYLLDRVYTPDGLVERYSQLSGTNVDRYNAMNEDLGLPYVGLATKWSHVVAALREGKLVVLLLNNGSPLTVAQHFVLLTGITEKGKILVMDPFQPNYRMYPQSFEKGFDQKLLSGGFDGAWIYEKQPRDPDFDQKVLEAYTGIRGKSEVLDLCFSDK